MACDEAVRIKSNESYTSLGVRQLRPQYRLVLTGTPIKNHLIDIFWLIHWACGGHTEPCARWPYGNQNSAKEEFGNTHMFMERNHTREEKAAAAGKHILSQKPFALDAATGQRLVACARDAGVRIAVNQNGRWAPYFCYLREAVKAGVIGDVGSVHMVLNWDHTWTAGTPFEEIHHLMFEDFGIHWFDAVRSFFPGADAVSVAASVSRFPSQPVKPPLLGGAIVAFPEGMATLAFNGGSRFGARETCTITGTKGTLHAVGEICGIREVEVHTEEGSAIAKLDGSWFPDGFRGAMGELMRAIEEDREPENSAADNLKSLALVRAAMESADTGKQVAPDFPFLQQLNPSTS